MKNRKRIILTIALLSYFVTAIDSSIVITGLEKMTEELSLNQTTLSWVQNAYVLAFGGFILLGGKLSDIFGRKHIINMALILFGGASAVGGCCRECRYYDCGQVCSRCRSSNYGANIVGSLDGYF